jgi:hypothetical protein
MKEIVLVLALLLPSLVMASEDNQPAYDVVLVERTGGDWRAIRYMPATGRSWYIRNGVFIELLEKSLIPESKYKIVTTKHKAGWAAVRLDMVSGDAWKLKSEIWVKIKETK